MSQVGCWVVVLSIATSVATADGAAFRFAKPVEVPPLEQEEMVAVRLDGEVFAATEPGLSDVRILDGDGAEVSFVLRKATTARTETSREHWPAREPMVRPLDDGSLEIVVRLDERDPQPQGIRFISPLQNFEHRVRVFGTRSTAERVADDDWQPLATDGVIFDYSRYMDVRSDTLSVGAGEHRRFRIVIDDVTAEQELQLMELTRRLRGAEELERQERVRIDRRPFRISRLEFWRDVTRERVSGEEKSAYPVRMVGVEENAEDKQTLVTIESGREPLTALRLVTPARNFSRGARVEVEHERGVQREWRRIGSATVTRLDFRDLKREELAVTFPESRQPTYRLVIDNRDSAPLEVTGVEAEGNVYEAVFLAAPREEYRFVYGNPQVESPRYDLATIQTSLGQGYRPISASLGQQTTLAEAIEDGAWTFGRLLNNTWLLVAAIIVLMLLLGWGLYQASRRLADLPED